MRTQILYSLFSDITIIKGIGTKVKNHINRVAGNRIKDLIYHIPADTIERKNINNIAHAKDGDTIIISVEIQQHIIPTYGSRKKTPYRIKCYHPTGFITLSFFNGHADYLKQNFPIGITKIISGKVEVFHGELQIMHPDFAVAPTQANTIPNIEAVYPLTAGLSNKQLSKYIQSALEMIPNLPEWINQENINKHKWLTWQESLRLTHNPNSPKNLQPDAPNIKRLAYDELFANQLALQITRKQAHNNYGRIIQGDGNLRKQLLNNLGFELTNGQKQVITEILTEQAANNSMSRLLQGDVGSGKTVVSLMVMLNAVEAKTQAAIMAPTAILANQHYGWISQVTENIKVNIALLTGKTKKKDRITILEQLANNEIDILIGTHALFQDDVIFHNLSLVIIDEQQRFGVEQRFKLAQKGNGVDLLLMTATPIPRTLAMTLYGDMLVSILSEKPANRKPIDTRTIPLDRMDEVIAGISRKMQERAKTYWICPLVEESEKMDLAAAEERFKQMEQLFPGKVGLAHGKMSAADRDATMLDFRDGDIDLLVATTVVEVGVDVRDATIIVIEHAERFGLSQLHQLRGRVGRGDKESVCILLYNSPLGYISQERLKAMRDSQDGFYLAEKDMKLRGSGDILGTKQSGMPSFKIANIREHYEIIKLARQDAIDLIAQDPQLQSVRGQHARNLLYLLEYDKYIYYANKG